MNVSICQSLTRIRWVIGGLLIMLHAPSFAGSFKVEFDEAVVPLIDKMNVDLVAAETRLSEFVEQNLLLEKHLTVRIYGGQESYIDSETNIGYVSVGSMTSLKDSIDKRYPKQSEVREALLTSAIEQLYWQQAIRLLVSILEIPIEGEETFVLDGFVALIQLNAYEAPFVLDAAEELLKVDQYFPVFTADAYKTEEEFDKARYHHMACLVLGKDFDLFEGVLSELSWGESRLSACQKQYSVEWKRWKQSLQPHLKPNSALNG